MSLFGRLFFVHNGLFQFNDQLNGKFDNFRDRLGIGLLFINFICSKFIDFVFVTFGV
jgi:hypothetical protein